MPSSGFAPRRLASLLAGRRRDRSAGQRSRQRCDRLSPASARSRWKRPGLAAGAPYPVAGAGEDSTHRPDPPAPGILTHGVRLRDGKVAAYSVGAHRPTLRRWQRELAAWWRMIGGQIDRRAAGAGAGDP